MLRLFEYIGRQIALLLGEVLDLFAMIHISIISLFSLHSGPKRSIFWQLFKRQVVSAGVGSLYLVSAIGALTGMLLTVMLWRYFQGQAFTDVYAQFFIIVILRELAPLICGIVLITRSATAITAEISYLKISHEFDVLRNMGINPVLVFLLPVFVAFPLILLTTVVYFDFMAILGGYGVIALLEPNRGLYEFVGGIIGSFDLDRAGVVLGKSVLGGFFIGVICIYFGAKSGHRFTDMSVAISRGATAQLIIFFTINMTFSTLLYLSE